MTPIHGEVARTAELDRVVALPRYVDRPNLAEEMTRLLGGQGMTLRPIQAETLHSLKEFGGAFCSIPVGGGKTLISYLAPAVVGARRPVLLIPGKLRRKTERDFKKLREHWPATNIKIVSYEKLSRSDALDGADLIVADECHRLKNISAGCTRRFVQYMATADIPVLCMSGTITSRSLLDFWHLLGACLGTDRMPLPVIRAETQRWANAVDEKVDIRARPGALVLLGCPPTVSGVRAAVGARIRDTPGVVHQESTDVAASIEIEVREIVPPQECISILRKMARKKEGPMGEELTPADVWRHARTLLLGFVYVYDPQPPDPWAQARKRWKRQVRSMLEAHDPSMKTELEVANAARHQKIDDRAWKAWVEIRPTFDPVSVPIWYSTERIEEIAKADTDWVWVGYEAVGRKLAEVSGWPYYHRKGMCGRKFVDDHIGGPAILSIDSNCEGRNLQHRSRNLVTSVPTKGQVWQQLIGRTHRPGQQADTVEVVVLARPDDADLQQALDDAEYAQKLTDEPQKLLMADWV